MLGTLAANAFPSQMYGTKLKVFWTGTPDKVDDRVMTRRTYGACPTQTLQLDNTYIPIDDALEFMTVRNSTIPYQGSGEYKHIRIFHGLRDLYQGGGKEGICHINVGPLLITMVIDDQMDLLMESIYTIWDYYGVLPVYSGQLTTGEYAYATHPDIPGKKRPLAGGDWPGEPRPRT